eukprot:TRINITY_DN1711_c0_g1_i3.p1 TRINITY_DN1711_c0_g1~~TRINITY_DN1711_c0_g1_i3.p1  ORF type:complete len:713 (-),score=177.87 TRINITY_DN1711_c0_g1_i3:71-2209(-)
MGNANGKESVEKYCREVATYDEQKEHAELKEVIKTYCAQYNPTTSTVRDRLDKTIATNLLVDIINCEMLIHTDECVEHVYKSINPKSLPTIGSDELIHPRKTMDMNLKDYITKLVRSYNSADSDKHSSSEEKSASISEDWEDVSGKYHWEWNDGASWIPYDDYTSSLIEKNYEASKKTFDLSHGVFSSGYTINLNTLTQTNNKTRKQRKIRRVSGVVVASSSTTAKWEWKDDSKWVEYDATTSDILERAFMSKQTKIRLSHGFFGAQGGYDIDLTKNEQTKISTKFKRSIRRINPTPSPSSTKKPTSRRSSTATKSSKPSVDVTGSTPVKSTASISSSTDEPSTVPSTSGTSTTDATTTTTTTTTTSTTTPPTDGSGKVIVVPPGQPAPTGNYWEFSEEGKWIPFDKMSNRIIDGSYSQGRYDVSLNHGEFTKNGAVVIDFTTFIVTNKKSGLSTQVKRTPPATMKVKPTILTTTATTTTTTSTTSTTPATTPAKPASTSIFSNLFSTPSTPASSGGDKVKECQKLTNWKIVKKTSVEKPEIETCPICTCNCFDDDDEVIIMSKCVGHYFHVNCIVQCNTSGFIQCPICNQVYGVRIGNMPKGTMNVTYTKTRLEGVTNASGTIQIDYSFPDGIQGPEHIRPGLSYSGTTRTCYLPDNAEGKEVLRLLKVITVVIIITITIAVVTIILTLYYRLHGIENSLSELVIQSLQGM